MWGLRGSGVWWAVGRRPHGRPPPQAPISSSTLAVWPGASQDSGPQFPHLKVWITPAMIYQIPTKFPKFCLTNNKVYMIILISDRQKWKLRKVKYPPSWYIQSTERKHYPPRILYQAKLSFKSEGEIKTFPDKQKLREFITTRPLLREMLKAVLLVKMKEHQKVNRICKKK